MQDQYRKNVGIVVFRQDLKVLMCARADQDGFQWQFPQGGIDENENFIDAARRELQEETGIVSIEYIACLPRPLRYDFPAKILSGFQQKGSPYRGQEQRWVLFYFTGQDSEINFCTNPEEIEFKSFEWVDISEAPKRIVSFKRKIYKKVAEFFKKEIQRQE